MPDYQKELEKYPDASPEDKKDLAKLATLQKDIAIGGSAEDFIRHPFFKSFENKMNDMINDSKGAISALLKKPGVTIAEAQAAQAGIDSIVELKKWLNSHVIAKRVAAQAIEMYEADTETINDRIQAAIDKAQE